MGLFESRSLSYQDVWGSGEPWNPGMSVDRALSLAPVYASVRLLAESIASLPLKQYKKTRKGSKELEKSAGFLNPSLSEPTVFAWKYQIVTSLALRGNAFGLVTAVDGLGYPTQIAWLNPDLVMLEPESTVTNPRWSINGKHVNSESLVHIAGLTQPGQILGVSPIQAFKDLFNTGLMAQKAGHDFYENGAIPSGIVKVEGKVSQEEANTTKRRFKAAAAGRDVVVLGLGTDYKPISLPPAEAQFLETIKATSTMIAAIYGVPAEEIGGQSGGSLTYTNEEQRAIRFLNFSLRPWIVRIESSLNRLVPPNEFLKFNVDSMLRVDLKTRYESYAIARDYGFISVNEIRDWEEKSALPAGEGDIYTPLKYMKGTQNGESTER